MSFHMAVAANPTLRMMQIRNGSLLDKRRKAKLEQLAEEKDMQVFLEVVDTDQPCAVVIEDGHVKEDDDDIRY